jgi:hypothetical protein
MHSKLSPWRLIVLIAFFHLLVSGLPPMAFSSQEGAYLLFDNFTLPDSATLCGESIPIEKRSVYEMLDRELTIVVWDRAQVFMWLKRAGRFFPIIEKKLAEAGMPDDLKYLTVAESSLLTHAKSDDGAKGLWQLMSHTARHNGIRNDDTVDERLEFEQATNVALRYLQMLKDKFGTWALTLAAYNCGEGCIRKEIKKQQVTDYYRLNLPLETERFVFRIAAIKTVMDNPGHFGYRLKKEHEYRPIQCDTVSVEIELSLHMTDFARALDTDFKVLKELNPKIPGYLLPPGSYVLRVPSGTASMVPAVVEKLTKSASRLKRPSHFYIVRHGDTLGAISQRTGVPVSTLKNLNRIRGPLIRVGQKLRLER